jgi:hypothetical protein
MCAAASKGPDSETATPVARLRGPAELAAALPHLCGFVPTESLVVVALHGPRHRVGLTMRIDLPPRAHEEAVAADLVERLQRTGAGDALVLVCTDAADDHDLPRAGLVRRVRRRLAAGGVRCDDALLVRAGRWASYVCSDPRCCPRGGTPLAQAGSTPALSLVQADAVGRGVAVLPDRDALVASLTAPARDPAVVMALHGAAARRSALVTGQGAAVAGRADLAAWRAAIAAPEVDLPPEQRAALVLALSFPAVRDEVLSGDLTCTEQLLAVLLALARWTPSPDDAQVCAVLGWTAHLIGNGSLAGIALERALRSDPRCGLAQLGGQALDAQLPPQEVRRLLVESNRVLRRTHPWTAP